MSHSIRHLLRQTERDKQKAYERRMHRNALRKGFHGGVPALKLKITKSERKGWWARVKEIMRRALRR